MASKSTASSDSPLAEGAGVLIGGGQRHSARFTSSSDDSPQLPLNNGIFAATNTNSTSKKRLVNQNTKANLNTKTTTTTTTTTTTNSNGKLNRSFTSLNLSASSLPSSSSKRQHTNSTSSSSHIATNHHGHSRSKPAELYRTDFITAMKIPDTEVLDEENYFLIKDPWRLEWERGVQVPMKPDNLYRPNFMCKPDQYSISYNNYVNNSISRMRPPSTKSSTATADIKMPKKYLCPTFDKKYDASIHEAYLTHGLINDTSTTASLVCRYDCDDMDLCWLARVNHEFALMGVHKMTRVDLERLIENFEVQSHENFKRATDKLESYSIEYDEGIVCDVCHMPDSEDANEMVFCDGCNICVHQACYGIAKIPQGNWLCVPCTFGGSKFKPECVLCPNVGGAMKATKNFRNWAHVSCALWIPEVGFGNEEKMEPIVNLNQILATRWRLVCGICKEKRGCCLQCSEKRCHAAFHVSCAFKFSLEMQQQNVSDNDDENNIVFKAYCKTHTKKRQMMQQNFEDNELEDAGELEEQSEVFQSEEENNRNKRKPKAQDETKSANTTPKNAKAPKDANGDEGNASDQSDNEDPEHNLSSLATMSETERKLEIIKRILKLKRQFYKNISLEHAQSILSIKARIHVDFAFGYWKLKRRFNKQSITLCDNKLMPSFDKALITPKGYETDLLNRSEHLMIARIKMFHSLRQNLEKLRTLSYMVVKREKLKRQLNETNQRLFEKQADYLCKYSNQTVVVGAGAGATPSVFTTNPSQNPVVNNTSSSLLSTSTSPLTRRGRFSDKLQIKNEQCIYDFPELWLLNENSNSFNNSNNNNNNSSTASDLDESNSDIKDTASSSNQPTTSSSASSSSSSISSNRHAHLTLENLKKATCNSKSVNELEILETSSSTSNSNKENFTTTTTTRDEVSSKKSKKSSTTATTSPSLKSQSKKSETITKNNSTITINNINSNNSSSSNNSSGKSLTNKIKNKYKNISKKENRLQIQNRSQKINTSSSSSSSSSKHTDTPSSSTLSNTNSSPSSSSSSSSTLIINQINSNIASLKKPTSLLNLSMIRDELMTTPESQPGEAHNSNLSTSTTNRDKKLRNSTNLSLRTTRQQKQQQHHHQPQLQQPPKVILTHVTSPKSETLATPLKRLNGQNDGDYMLTTPIDADGGIMSKRRKLTETNLLKNQGSNSSSLATAEMIEGGGGGGVASQSTTASTNVSLTPPSESRTRFSLRINNTSK